MHNTTPSHRSNAYYYSKTLFRIIPLYFCPSAGHISLNFEPTRTLAQCADNKLPGKITRNITRGQTRRCCPNSFHYALPFCVRRGQHTKDVWFGCDMNRASPIARVGLMHFNHSLCDAHDTCVRYTHRKSAYNRWYMLHKAGPKESLCRRRWWCAK